MKHNNRPQDDFSLDQLMKMGGDIKYIPFKYIAGGFIIFRDGTDVNISKEMLYAFIHEDMDAISLDEIRELNIPNFSVETHAEMMIAATIDHKKIHDDTTAYVDDIIKNHITK